MSSVPARDFRTRVLRLWLLAVAALVVATLIVGGATRLTESGLSIVEWRPLTGTVPPLSQDAWTRAFEKYKAIPQFQKLNSGMSLSDFKTIYWWEWTHRLLGRVIGVVFLLPFLVLLWRGWIGRDLRARLWIIFGLGAAQGAVGWWMVSSGLAERTSVSPYRLAFHMTLACVIYAALVWTLRRLTAPPGEAPPPRLRGSALALLCLTLLQIYVGALVAGLDAGLTFNTWPLIDGAFVPAADRLLLLSPAWRNLFENELAVQFMHRMLAYALWLAALLHAADALRTPVSARVRATALALAAAVTLQAGVGIVTLLWVAPIGLALTHQAAAIVVLTMAVLHAERISRTPAATAPAQATVPAFSGTAAAGASARSSR